MINYIISKRIVTFMIIIMIIGCKKQENRVKYYPNAKLYNKPKTISLNLDTINLNFKQITNKISQLQDQYKIPLIEIKDGKYKKIIFPLVYDGSFIKKRNVLYITSDSILIDKGYSIKELKKILKRHYKNNGKDYRYPESFEKASVEITVDTNTSGKRLKKSLIYLTKVFDEVNNELKDSLELRIYFDYFRQIQPPALFLQPLDN